VRPLLDRQEAAEVRFWHGVRESLEKLAHDDKPVVLRKPEAGALQVIDARLRCAPSCRVALTVANPGATRAFATDFYQARLVLDDGRAVEIDTPWGELPPGGRATLMLTPKDPLPPASLTAKPWRVVVNGFRRLEILPIAAD
jgi:hypothetical protein